MIFPAHRMVAQLVRDADMTIEEATQVVRGLKGVQGTLAPEDFFELGHSLAYGGVTVVPDATHFAAVGVAITDTSEPFQITVERIHAIMPAVLDTGLYIIKPSDLASFGASNARFRDGNKMFAKPTSPLAAPHAVIISSNTLAANVGDFVGPWSAQSVEAVADTIVREGWGLALESGAVNETLRATFFWREKALRIR